MSNERVTGVAASFVRTYTHAHIHTRARARERKSVRAVVWARRAYVWVLTFHDLSRSFQRASKHPESAQIDKRNNRGREIEGLDQIGEESARRTGASEGWIWHGAEKRRR